MFLLGPFISWLKRHFRPNVDSEQFHFTENWFEDFHDQHLDTILTAYKNQPGVKYLEIGVYEGRSLFWMFKNILTHPTSSAVTIDLRHRPQTVTFRQNLKASGQAHRVQTLWGRSEDLLRELPKGSFDIIYVDGDHDARGVMIDAIHSWHLLKPGGILIFDDYEMMRDRFPEDLRPEIAVDAFVQAFQSELTVLRHGYQVIVQKKSTLRLNGETQIGKHIYNWYSKKFYRVYLNQKFLRRQVTISDEQQNELERVLKKRFDSENYEKVGRT